MMVTRQARQLACWQQSIDVRLPSQSVRSTIVTVQRASAQYRLPLRLQNEDALQVTHRPGLQRRACMCVSTTVYGSG